MKPGNRKDIKRLKEVKATLYEEAKRVSERLNGAPVVVVVGGATDKQSPATIAGWANIVEGRFLNPGTSHEPTLFELAHSKHLRIGAVQERQARRGGRCTGKGRRTGLRQRTDGVRDDETAGSVEGIPGKGRPTVIVAGTTISKPKDK